MARGHPRDSGHSCGPARIRAGRCPAFCSRAADPSPNHPKRRGRSSAFLDLLPALQARRRTDIVKNRRSRNRAALLRDVAALFALAGLAVGEFRRPAGYQRSTSKVSHSSVNLGLDPGKARAELIHRHTACLYPCRMTNAQGNTINWDKAIARNRDALLRIVAALFAMTGLVDGESGATLPRRLHNHILRILRAANPPSAASSSSPRAMLLWWWRAPQTTQRPQQQPHRPRRAGLAPARSPQAVRRPPAPPVRNPSRASASSAFPNRARSPKSGFPRPTTRSTPRGSAAACMR